MQKPLHYPLANKDSLPRWREQLLQHLPLEPAPPQTDRVHYYDSFDWRLFQANKVLAWHQRNADSQLCLLSAEDNSTQIAIRLEQAPSRFADELPPGQLRQELVNLLDLRALLPVATIETRSLAYRWIDKEGKTRLRLYLEHHRLVQPEGKRSTLCKRIRLEPLQGYKKTAERVISVLEKEFGLRPGDEDLLSQALASMHKIPGDYTSKLNIPLEPELRADAAMRRILLTLLETMEINEAGTIDNLDTEFLHDFRVAVRRTRSALGQMKTVFPAATLSRFRDKFAWLGTITSPTRDLDVYLLKFENYQNQLPEPLQADLEPLRAFLIRHHGQEQTRLSRELQTAGYRQLKNQWRRYLTSPLPKRPVADDASSPIGEVGPRRTWRMYKRVLREGQAITPASPAEDLHELRKSCKKLRYLMEFFQRLYSTKEIRALIKELKGLQENLGDFQDLEVQIHTLKQYSEQMKQEGDMTPRTELAMDILLKSLETRMQEVRDIFDSRFQRFACKSNEHRFRRLFHPSQV
jgi:CHAD domain-containing protein